MRDLEKINISIFGEQMEKIKVLEAAAPNIIIIVIIYTIMLFFKLDFIGLLLVITVVMGIYMAWKKTKPVDALKGILKTLLFLSALHLAWGILGAYAIYGLVVYVIVVSVLAILRQKEIITMAIDEMELAIYGREFKKGEKRPKIKFVKKKSCDKI